ncbi:hypothetical protein OPV22_014206 [Ensete ventricosum]|uniref:GATA-type domain-containing protein n=1 Tax=Ensete ventricosum TaxID=4639 RepID=A0AAV8R748_ENSVE|nr:hypothetical protein OPV22_014206 [Ensete ventricosum]
MEAPQYFHGGFYRDGNPQCAPERKAGGGGEQFSVEDLLDFSNEEEDEAGGLAAAGEDGAAGNSTDSSTVTAVDSCGNSFSALEPHFSSDLVCRSLADASLSGDLCEPYDELAELEWLSNFVEESFSSEDLHKLHLVSGVNSTTTSSRTTAAAATRAEFSAQEAANQVAPFRSEALVPGKARSKRSRAAPCSWSSRLLVLSPSLTAAPSPESELIVPPSAAAAGAGGKKAAKPASKKKDMSAGPAVVAAPDDRKCLHCQTDKTPQWRTGPMGPKTLCNACGVRYKSGRLVLELRRQKELQQQHLHAGGGASLCNGPTPVDAAAADDFLIHGPDYRHLI